MFRIEIKNSYVFLLIILISILSFFCSYQNKKDNKWYKGNTHAHTVLCGHADSSPSAVAKWYHDHGYNFLILSEHNKFINPDTVKLPENRRPDFILIPGEEVTGKKVIHTTAMNIDSLVDWNFDHEHKSEIIQYHVNETIKSNGTPILNHPNYKWAVSALDILPVKKLHHFELFNGHPLVQNEGDKTHHSTEKIWDILLSSGMAVYGISSDDAHHFQTWDHNHSNPGRGWVMVSAYELTSDAITTAMKNGDFYASNGVILSDISKTNNKYSVTVNESATQKELSSSILKGKIIENGKEGYRIECIGDAGKILFSENSTFASYNIGNSNSYVRCKITYTRKKDNNFEEFYAWTQPVFTDDRLTKIR